MLVIDLGEKNYCICKKIDSIPSECVNEYRFSDSGKSVQLKPKHSEKTYTFLVELKGKNHIENAFDQLSRTREYVEYQNIIEQLENPINRYTIVSDVQLDKLKLQKLEKKYKIRVGSILYSEPCSKVPDLKCKI